MFFGDFAKGDPAAQGMHCFLYSEDSTCPPPRPYASCRCRSMALMPLAVVGLWARAHRPLAAIGIIDRAPPCDPHTLVAAPPRPLAKCGGSRPRA